MKSVYLFLFVFCLAESRKTYAPYDKNANLAFINMEAGGARQPAPQPQAPPANKQPVSPTAVKPQPVPAPAPAKVVPAAKPAPAPKPTPTPAPKPVPVAKPAPAPHQIKPVPVNPAPVAHPVSTPGPGSVKQLVNFYDSQGKASQIRPYSYSQAVKQG